MRGVGPGVGSVGVDPSGADASGADAAATGPALDDSSRVEDPGAGQSKLASAGGLRHLQH
jgi:hypothetical protein